MLGDTMFNYDAYNDLFSADDGFRTENGNDAMSCVQLDVSTSQADLQTSPCTSCFKLSQVGQTVDKEYVLRTKLALRVALSFTRFDAFRSWTKEWTNSYQLPDVEVVRPLLEDRCVQGILLHLQECGKRCPSCKHAAPNFHSLVTEHLASKPPKRGSKAPNQECLPIYLRDVYNRLKGDPDCLLPKMMYEAGFQCEEDAGAAAGAGPSTGQTAKRPRTGDGRADRSKIPVDQCGLRPMPIADPTPASARSDQTTAGTAPQCIPDDVLASSQELHTGGQEEARHCSCAEVAHHGSEPKQGLVHRMSLNSTEQQGLESHGNDYRDQLQPFPGSLICFPQQKVIAEAQHAGLFLVRHVSELREKGVPNVRGCIQSGVQIYQIDEEDKVTLRILPRTDSMPSITQAYYGKYIEEQGCELFVEYTSHLPITCLKLYSCTMLRVVSLPSTHASLIMSRKLHVGAQPKQTKAEAKAAAERGASIAESKYMATPAEYLMAESVKSSAGRTISLGRHTSEVVISSSGQPAGLLRLVVTTPQSPPPLLLELQSGIWSSKLKLVTQAQESAGQLDATQCDQPASESKSGLSIERQTHAVMEDDVGCNSDVGNSEDSDNGSDSVASDLDDALSQECGEHWDGYNQVKDSADLEVQFKLRMDGLQGWQQFICTKGSERRDLWRKDDVFSTKPRKDFEKDELHATCPKAACNLPYVSDSIKSGLVDESEALRMLCAQVEPTECAELLLVQVAAVVARLRRLQNRQMRYDQEEKCESMYSDEIPF